MIEFNETFSRKLIYVLAIPDVTHKGLLKIGEATIEKDASDVSIRDNSDVLMKSAKKRIDSYTKTAGLNYEILYTTQSINISGNGFNDHKVHDVLKRSNIKQPKEKLNGATEWFQCDLKTSINAINAVKNHRHSLLTSEISQNQTPIVFRPEQKDAIKKTLKQYSKKGVEIDKSAHMLWNAKMRFGKTLSALQIIKEMKFSKSIIVTHRPVVKDSWFEDFNKIFYDDPSFIYGSRTHSEQISNLVKFNSENKSIVYFASLQDLRESLLVGGKYNKNDLVFNLQWDFVIVDEAHEGTQTSKGNEVIQKLITSNFKTKALYLSGTPFNLLGASSNQIFKPEEVYTWDYVMEQSAKLEWVEKHFGDSNPYEGLPKLNIFTYDLADIISNGGYSDIEDKAFNFKEFFKVIDGDFESIQENNKINERVGDFIHEKDIQRFLDLLVLEGTHNYPFSTPKYRDYFRHTLWMLPGVKEARALSKLLKEHPVFKFFEIVNVAGSGDLEIKSEDALSLVNNAIGDNPEETRSITLSCGKLTTGVSVPAWTGVFMLSGSAATSASSYLQTIFRVQTPAEINGKIKTNCYVFDFAPDRTLKMVAEAGELSTKKGATNDNKSKMGSFLNFCPIISVEGSEMVRYSVNDMLKQLKKALIDRVAKSGFDDRHLYNDNLLSLSEIEINKFKDLKKLLKASGSAKISGDIRVNDQGFDFENYSTTKDKKRHISEEEKKVYAEKRKAYKERANAIRTLRGIAIRVPLLIFGADIDIDERIGVDNFTEIIDDTSWEEFMPKDVSKELFKEFSKYFDNEVFVEAGLKIRRKIRAADELMPLERVQVISDIFSTFKNPDKETVLTPWRAVNMHMGETLGGASFYLSDYETKITIDDNQTVRWINRDSITDHVFNTNSKILDINSKTGLYPLYSALSIFQNIRNKGLRKNTDHEWDNIINQNIFVICRTKMASAIVKRTLVGFRDKKHTFTNIRVIEDIVRQMSYQYKNDYNELYEFITNSKTWGYGENIMKFDAVVGNPPYQSNSKQQIYADFYLLSRKIGSIVSLVFPTGWQQPKNANNLSKLNSVAIKKDPQIVFIDNRNNVFPGISGAENVNFILWQKGYDNELDGAQKIYQNGENFFEKILPIEKKDIVKPPELVEMAKLVLNSYQFDSFSKIVSSRKPYGMSTDFLDSPQKYYLPSITNTRNEDSDIRIFGLKNRKQSTFYIPSDYPLPKSNQNLKKYKVFIPYAWGNMDEKAGLGGAYSDIILGKPNDVCTESFQEHGSYSTYREAMYHAKFVLTKFARACLYLNKYSQHSTTSWGAVPIQDFKEPWWDENIENLDSRLFEKYSIPNYIRDFVLSNIQKKSISNIIDIE